MIYTYSIPQGGEINIIANNQVEAWQKYKEHMKDICVHVEFEKGICLDCDFECEHKDVDEWVCLDCGKVIENYDPRCEPEYGDSDR